MLRIISGLLLLIISQFSFASLSSTTYSATRSTTYVNYYSGDGGTTYTYASPADACTAYATKFYSVATAGNGGQTYTYLSYSLNSYQQAECLYNYKVWGVAKTDTKSYTAGYHQEYPYVCSSGGTLSGTTCTKDVDSCTSYAGQSGYFWVNKVNPPSTICSGTCLAHANAVVGFPDADPLSWQYLQYTYTGETSGCSADSGFTDEAAAAAANAAAAERERLKKIEAAIAAAKAACGGEGHYTTGTFNGDTVVSCKDEPTQTTVNNTAVSTTTTANPDGSTTTTTTTTTNNNTSITNNNSSTTISGSNGGTSTSPATTGGSSTSTTKTESVTTNPDGSTTTEVTETTSGAGNTAGVFESPTEGTDYLKDVFGSESLKQLVDQQTAVKEQITLLQSNIKGLFNFSSIAAGGSMEANTQTIMGASVDLSGKSIIDLFTQGNIASAFWILAVLIGITVVLTKRT